MLVEPNQLRDFGVDRLVIWIVRAKFVNARRLRIFPFLICLRELLSQLFELNFDPVVLLINVVVARSEVCSLLF